MKWLRDLCVPIVFALVTTGCDVPDRVSNVEKQVKELQTSAEKNEAVQDYDLQAKCAKDARQWFDQNWSRDKDTLFLDFTNHYNKRMNKCFIDVEYHFSGTAFAWTNEIMIYDIYENTQYGKLSQGHVTMKIKGEPQEVERISTCEVKGKKCTSLDEFNNLAGQFMEN
jgi:hypothetical protein